MLSFRKAHLRRGDGIFATHGVRAQFSEISVSPFAALRPNALHTIAVMLIGASCVLSGCSLSQVAASTSAPPVVSPTTSPLASDALPETVSKALSAGGLPPDALAFVVMRADTGAVLAAQFAGRPMQPASTLKVLTSAVAFDRLGRGYRGRSMLMSSGEIRDGVLRGDLVLRGEGDVDLDLNALRRMLYALKARGVTAIVGDVVLDRSWIAPARPDVGVPPFDETPEFRYNVVPDAISLGTNLTQLDIVSTNDKVTVSEAPRLPKIEFVSSLTLSDRACKDWEDGWLLPTVTRGGDGAARVELRGDFPRGCVAATQINVVDRTDYANAVFRALWAEVGGRLDGKVREAEAAPVGVAALTNGANLTGMVVLASHQSRALPEMIHDVLKRSDNPNTRLLFYALSGARHGDESVKKTASSTSSAEQVRAWLAEQKINAEGLVLDNGSGLSRTEKITPIQLANALRVAHSKSWAAEFQAAFPVVGVDGGMRNRLANSSLAGRARLKTGTLRDVSALAGYLPGANGEALVFVAMLNHPLATSKASRPVLDALLLHAATLGK
jgi:D-alanyl-D-alanine carboxypeptidase/D-alanyl-D-alanine-endopeptidase (penicillin-binding protein 4)